VRILKLALPLLVLGGCTNGMGYSYEVTDSDGGHLGKCHVDAFNAFCQVQQPAGTAVVTGTPIVPGIGALTSGIGSMMLGEGTIAGSAAVLVK
jgi:hypothetical protein